MSREQWATTSSSRPSCNSCVSLLVTSTTATSLSCLNWCNLCQNQFPSQQRHLASSCSRRTSCQAQVVATDQETQMPFKFYESKSKLHNQLIIHKNYYYKESNGRQNFARLHRNEHLLPVSATKSSLRVEVIAKKITSRNEMSSFTRSKVKTILKLKNRTMKNLLYCCNTLSPITKTILLVIYLLWLHLSNKHTGQAAATGNQMSGVSELANIIGLSTGSGAQPQHQRSSSANLIAPPANSLTPSSAIATYPQASSREIEKQIVDKILGEGYDKRIRPAGSGPYNASRPGSDGPTIVRVNTLVRSISKIDDVTMEYSVQLSLRQEWTDDRLAFGKMPQYKNYGLNSITLTEQERLWKPDLFFRNEKEGHFHKIIMPNVLLRIKGEGEVLYSIRISLVLACPMDLKYYPLDKQNCTIEMASYGYLDEDLKFIWKEENPVQIAKALNLPRFTLETHGTAYCTSRTTTGAYSCLRIDLIFKREFSYYLIQIYIPCCMLVIVSWVSFWLDPNAIPARVSLGVTTLLTMATQISGINASLPPVSYTKAIDVWTGVCLTFVFGALLEFALVNYASRSDQHKREMLTSALTHTQQMRWREATAAAAAAGVAPPTSPPPDENSPSMLAQLGPNGKPQPAFFGQLFTPTQGASMVGVQLHPQVVTAGPIATADSMFKPTSGGVATSGATLRSAASLRGIATVEGSNGGQAAGAANGKIMANGGHNQAANNLANKHMNCALQYLKSPREVHMVAPKRKNWCKMWLAKFPTRSKRIDVISRIFFPLKFALFNLVYWTTYLFREEDTVA